MKSQKGRLLRKNKKKNYEHKCKNNSYQKRNNKMKNKINYDLKWKWFEINKNKKNNVTNKKWRNKKDNMKRN